MRRLGGRNSWKMCRKRPDVELKALENKPVGTVVTFPGLSLGQMLMKFDEIPHLLL